MKKLITGIMVVILFGCAETKTLKFKTDTFMSAGKEKQFEVEIPKGYKNVEENLDTDLLKQYNYPDGSSLYVSLDINYSNSPNKENWSKCSNPQTGFKCEEGEQANSLFWKEILSNNLVIGYFNVTKERKAEFDKAIASLKELGVKTADSTLEHEATHSKNQ